MAQDLVFGDKAGIKPNAGYILDPVSAQDLVFGNIVVMFTINTFGGEERTRHLFSISRAVVVIGKKRYDNAVR